MFPTAPPGGPGQPGTNSIWPGGFPSPTPAPGPGPGGWPSPGPAPGPAPGPGGWPSPGPAPGPAPGPGGWPSPAPGPGGWPSPGPAPGPGGWPSPAPGPGGWPSPGPAPGPAPGPQQNLSVPFNQKLPRGVYHNLLIIIEGKVKCNADKFTVDLHAGNDIALHFNPRFNENGRKVVVRNSFIKKIWGKEERELSRFPFTPGEKFEMKILCTNTEFKVAVNNNHLLTYRHRITDLRSINTLSIYYDVTLSNVKQEDLH